MPNNPDLRRLGDEVVERIHEAVDAYILRVRPLPGYGADHVPQDSLVASTARLMTLLIQTTVIDEGSLGGDLMEGTQRATKMRAEQGVPIDSMMRALHIGADELRRSLEITAEHLSIPAQVARRASDAMQDGIGDMMAWVVTAFSEFDQDRAREDHRRRERVFQDTLEGNVVEAHLLAHGLSIEETCIPVRARATVETQSPQLERNLLTFASEHGGLVASIGSDVAGILLRVPPELGDTLMGIGPPGPLSQAGRGFQLASRILETAAEFGFTGQFDLAGLGARVAIHSELELGATLVARFVTPTELLGEFGRALLATIDAFIENGMRHEPTARALHIHRNTLRYRLDRYAHLTGADLRAGQDLIHVWWALQRRRIGEPTDGSKMALIKAPRPDPGTSRSASAL